MKNIILQREISILLGCFVLSRVAVAGSGVRFQYEALFTYWQYLDVESLRYHALQSIWYMHGQPPLFNLFVAAVLKWSGGYERIVFPVVWMVCSFCNAVLLLRIVKTRVSVWWLPLAAALWYVLSPATILFENELFYTSITSLLLLLGTWFLDRFVQRGRMFFLLAFLGWVSMLCLTRTTFHLLWLAGIAGILAACCYHNPLFKKILVAGMVALLLVGSWYVKNSWLYGSFSVSSWAGINFSRIVFHDVAVRDSTSIAAIHPFLPISYYKRYIPAGYSRQFAGWDDRVLLREMKSDSAINMNHAGYIQVSRRYGKASLDYMAQHPAGYLKNAAASFIIFFTPASSYFQVEKNGNRLSVYDAVYSFNLSHFFIAERDKKIALALSALPKLLVYLLVIFPLAGRVITRKKISLVEACIAWTILYILVTSTLFEYGENMRFRYEIEPLFLILACDRLSKRIHRAVYAVRA